MSTAPPLAGRLLLRVAVPARDFEFVAGDLEEEFASFAVPALGLTAARRWYVRQAAASAWPFLVLRLRRGELAASVICAQIFFAMPVLGLSLLWMFVLSQVPLRADSPAPVFQVASTGFVLLLAWMAGMGYAVWFPTLCAKGARKGWWARSDRSRAALRFATCVGVTMILLAPVMQWSGWTWYLIAAGAPAMTAMGAWAAGRHAAGARGAPEMD